MKNNDKVRVRITNYNNKSRKGDYIVINEEGKKKRTFKYDQNKEVDYYVQAYTQNWTGKELKEQNKNWTQKSGRIEEYVNELKAQRRITSELRRGSTVRVNNLAMLANPAKREYEHKKLLEPLVLDKTLLNIVLANKDKLRTRFAHGITIWGKPKGTNHETILAHINDIGNKNLDDVYNEYAIKQGYKKGKELSYGRISDQLQELRLGSKAGKQYSNGTITRIEITTTFQKG